MAPVDMPKTPEVDFNGSAAVGQWADDRARGGWLIRKLSINGRRLAYSQFLMRQAETPRSRNRSPTQGRVVVVSLLGWGRQEPQDESLVMDWQLSQVLFGQLTRRYPLSNSSEASMAIGLPNHNGPIGRRRMLKELTFRFHPKRKAKASKWKWKWKWKGLCCECLTWQSP